MFNNNRLRKLFGSVTDFPLNSQSNAHFGSPLCQGFPLVPRILSMPEATAIATDERSFHKEQGERVLGVVYHCSLMMNLQLLNTMRELITSCWWQELPKTPLILQDHDLSAASFRDHSLASDAL